MPETPVDSFTGQMSFPLVNGAGRGAIGLTGDVEDSFFLAAWSDGAGGVMASFRQGTNEDGPPEVVGNFAVSPSRRPRQSTTRFSPSHFYVKAAWTVPWDLVRRLLANARPTANLASTRRGFGPFTVRLGQARAASCDGVAAQAGTPIQASGNASPVALNVAGGESEGEDDDDENEWGGGGSSVGGSSDDQEDDDD
ncbi:hypothetical protein INS49_004777 [Diaporthe citri]|uniref:uncharacterized protein n=1 Tax=Diaporthe citri TaxID=83186 RepID=UPI001C7E466A|nr:uncharacterized protein INS49_004777 [Diaporthe citri]KAG6354173.1 hypothetical protein INS49_004777 [Diaporthe citri]